MSDQRPILIAGPTASGKSGLAMRLAELLGGVVINADSMQVYRELRVLTARPSAADEARVPHRLYGFAAGAESYSAGRYAADVARALAEAAEAGLHPIIVGGTGLYFKALIEGLSPIPPVTEEARLHWRRQAEARGAAHVHAELAARDAVMAARLAPTDTQRIVRALEVLEATGRSLADWQRLPRQPVIDAARAIPLRIDIERPALVRNIETRFRRMVEEEGGLEEAQQLMRLHLDPSLPIMTVLGLRPLLRHLCGEVDLATAIGEGQAETRRYAKRQMTWARGNMIAWNTVVAQEMENIAPQIASFVQSTH